MESSNKPCSTGPEARPVERARSGRQRVLVIEEDAATGELLQTILEEEAGCETLWIRSASDALGLECPDGTAEKPSLDLVVVEVSIIEAYNARLLEDLRAKGVRLPP